MEIILRQPLKDVKITQLFGKDFLYSYNGKEVWFYKDIYGLNGHPGIDFKCNVGTPVYSANNGVCLYAGYDYTNGNLVQIWNKEKGFKTMYGHNSEFKVKQGDVVSAGQIIALSGGTGAGTGPHLHFGFKLTGNGGNGLNNNNGFNGATDPTPFIIKDYLGNNLIQKDMIIKKEKGKPDLWLIIESNNTKINLADMPSFAQLNEDIVEVDSLNEYTENGTYLWIDRKIN